MIRFVDDLDARYPTPADVDAIVEQARAERSRAMGTLASDIWTTLARVVRRRPDADAPRRPAATAGRGHAHG